MHSFDLRDDFGYCVGHHFTQGALRLRSLGMASLQPEPSAMLEGGGTLGVLSPKFCPIPVQTEAAIDRRVGVIHALGRVLLDRLREGIE